MKAALGKFNSAIATAEEAFAIVLFYALLGGVVTQVFTRFVLQSPLPWTEEFCRYVFVWLSAIGTSIGIRWGSHFVAVDLPGTLTGPVKMLVASAVKIGITIVALVLLTEGIHLTLEGQNQVTPILDMQMSWAYGAVPVSGGLMLWHLAMGLLFGQRSGGLDDLFGLEEGKG